jgi:ABC-type antimicrobial peptide transport system permease subunit
VVSLPYLVTDENYAKTYGLRLKEGRFLDHKALTDTLNEVVVNEAAVKAFGWQSGVGKKVKLAFAGIWVTVVGVVEDFNFFSLRKKVSPLAFANVSNFKRCKYVSVRFRTNNISGMMTGIKDKWNVFFPGKTLEYSFMDDKLKALYTSELQLRTTVNIATAMNMVIVFLSIFGVLVSALHKRAKEMAVRKVLGADTSSIVGIFVREYVYLILLALVIAGPLAYYLTDRWLQDYAYHITQNAIPYIVVAMVILAATTALIAGKCYKVASRNMMNSLRAE